MSDRDEVASTGPNWWARQREAFRDQMTNFDADSCRGCKWIGAGGMFGAGIYVAHIGYRRAKTMGSRWGFVPAAVASSVLFTLGAVRLTDYNPFSSSGRSFGIDALDPVRDMLSKSQVAAELRRKLQERAQQQGETAERMQDRVAPTERTEQGEMQGARQQDGNSEAPKE